MVTMTPERLRKARPDELVPFRRLLQDLRSRVELSEQRSVGTFHRGSRSFLHFHADGTRVIADVKVDGVSQRIAVSDDGGAALVEAVDGALQVDRHG
jgi:hypothetical protein